MPLACAECISVSSRDQVPAGYAFGSARLILGFFFDFGRGAKFCM